MWIDLIGGGSPKVAGYGFVASPSPRPGEDLSPFVTWGDVESTPVLLDPSSTPKPSRDGASFRMPATRKREEIARVLSEKATSSMRIKAQKLHKTKTQASSPAHLLVATKSKTVPASPHSQLRASYASPAIRTPGGSTPMRQHVTPKATPSTGQRPILLTPKTTPAATTTTTTTTTTSATKPTPSVTDDLLQF